MRYPKKRRATSLTLSRISYNMAKSLDWNFTLAEIDDVCASERYDLQCDLNSILLGKLPRFYLKKNGHLKLLSIDTVLESQFIDSYIVRTVLSEINREWLKEKPLQLVGKSTFGINFQDKPPKRVFSTDHSVDKCLTSFKNDVCECLIDFCQLLNSEDLYLFLTKNSCDIIVEKRFEKLRSELSRSIEKWCGNFKGYKELRKRSKNEIIENCFVDSRDDLIKVREEDDYFEMEMNDKLNESLTNNVMDIEQELDDIIQAQLFDIDLGQHQRSPDGMKSDIIGKGIAVYENNGKTEKTYAEEQASIQERLENEFDYFAKEIIKLNNEDIQMSKDSVNNKSVTGINIYEDIDADIIMANINDKNNDENLTQERSSSTNRENLKFTKRDIFVNDINITNKNVINRSLRKKKLDLDDFDDYDDVVQAQKKHKKRKEDKKHKKRKRNKHKNGSMEKTKNKSSKSSKNRPNGIEGQLDLPKKFTPNYGLYLDSPISYTLDPYQNNSGLDMNFNPEFDLLCAPKTGHENPLMQMLMDNYFSGSEPFLQGFIPDIKQFCIEMVNSKNAFLWALMLTNIDITYHEENRMYEEDPTIKKQQSKNTSNPLIQAFKQVVEAQKKDRISIPFSLRNRIQPKHGVTKSKFNFRHPPGLSSLFKLQTNLKSISRANIKEMMLEFQQKVFKLAKKESFIGNKENIANSTFTDIDYSVTPAHFSRVSKVLSVLYDEAEWKITNKIKMINFDRKFFNNAFAIQNSLYNPLLTDPNMLTSMYYQMQPMADIYTTVCNTMDGSTATTSNTQPSSDPSASQAPTSTNVSTVTLATVSATNTISNSTMISTTKTSNTTTASKTSVSTTSTNSISASPITYSGFTYNPYAAMQYPNMAWPFMSPMGYYMSDVSTLQAYHQSMYNVPNACPTSTDGSDFQVNTSTQAISLETEATYNANVNSSLGQNANANIDAGGLKGMVSSTAAPKKDVSTAASEGDRQGKNTRFYVFKNENDVSKDVEKFLDVSGLKKFDIHNLMLLRHLPNFECLVFVHKSDGNRVNEIPALLRLKRDLRVVFISYDTLEDVTEKRYAVIFPRAGTVLIDENALVACKSEVLESVCQFMKKQTFEKGTPWKLLITSRMFSILEKLKNDAQGNNDEQCRFGDMIQILQKFQTANIVEQLTDQYYMADPRTTADYQACFVALQRERYVSCRHFLFVTDMPRSHADSRMFLTNGIDIMNIAEFMRCFVSKTITHNPKFNEDHLTRTTPEKYIDAMISDCTQTITF